MRDLASECIGVGESPSPTGQTQVTGHSQAKVRQSSGKDTSYDDNEQGTWGWSAVPGDTLDFTPGKQTYMGRTHSFPLWKNSQNIAVQCSVCVT